jgi:tRNA(fMet)-specific endonuclease VapC
MKYLVDSDWVIDYLKGRQQVVQQLDAFSDEGLAISLITYGEVYEGIYVSADPKRHARGFRAFLEGVEVLPLNRLIMRRFARLRGDLRRKGQLINDPDIVIAATALHHRLTLLTNNTRHFERVPNLMLFGRP